MINAIRQFFEEKCRFKEDARDSTDHSATIHLTAAALMLEMARADHQSDDREYDTVVDALQKTWDIPEEDLGRLVAMAARSTHEATDLFEFTSLVNEHYSPVQKRALIESLWEVAFADGVLHHYEEHLVRKVAELIYVSHNEFIQTKLLVQERLGVA